jgi:DNA mismatch repair protein MutS2
MYETPKIDVHGMTSEQACNHVRYNLSEFKNRGYSEVFIIHGHGEGILKRDIRKMLLNFSFVKKLRKGRQDEGGDGVTVAIF